MDNVLPTAGATTGLVATKACAEPTQKNKKKKENGTMMETTRANGRQLLIEQTLLSSSVTHARDPKRYSYSPSFGLYFITSVGIYISFGLSVELIVAIVTDGRRISAPGSEGAVVRRRGFVVVQSVGQCVGESNIIKREGKKSNLLIFASRIPDKIMMCSITSSWILLLVLLLLLQSPRPTLCSSQANTTAPAAPTGNILVLGATGRTGSLLYHNLKETLALDHLHTNNNDKVEVRALVRSLDKARDILHCDKCDENEGIYQGDITNLTSLLPAFAHVQIVAIATGMNSRSGSASRETIRAVEYIGVQNAVRALAQDMNIRDFDNNGGGSGSSSLGVVLCSSRGTTTPPPTLPTTTATTITTSSYRGSNDGQRRVTNIFSDILFYKLNAEAFLGSIGMVTAIVKPCGLVDQVAGNRTLLALHDDAPTPTGSQLIPRGDVARVMAHLVRMMMKRMRQSPSPPPMTRSLFSSPSSSLDMNLRFDLCSIEGPGIQNLDRLVELAKWEWQQEQQGKPQLGLDDDPSKTMEAVPNR